MSREEEERRLRRELRRIQRKKQERIRQLMFGGLLCVSILILLASVIVLYKAVFRKKKADPKDVQVPEYVEVKLLTPNPYSRPELSLEEVNGIVVHYVANPGSTGWENRHYFEGLSESHETKAGAHFIIGLDGTIIQCVPLSELTYCSNSRNADTISIDCCHPEEDGKFTEETYNSLVKLCRWLINYYGLDKEDVIRHYDVTGKLCPLYFVEHEDAWEEFKNNLE